MKKSKLFILLPFLALTLAGCNTTTISQPSSSESSSEESKTTEDKGYSSYTLSFSFLYQGDLQSAPEGSSIYYAGDTNGWTFTPLKEDEGSYKLELGAIEYGTYSYKLLIEYDDETVGWDKEVYPKNADNSDATFTVSETDGGSQSIECTLDSYTLEDILGSKGDTGDTGDTGGTGDTGDDQGQGGDTGDDKGQGGDTGDTGGSTGDDKGEGGDTGDTGGDTGDTGDQGTGGDTGDDKGEGGDTGDTGDTGDDDDDDEDEDALVASAILKAVADTTITWEAFHGEYIDGSMDETDVAYLTTDNNGLYGSIIVYDDEDLDCSYYYANGYEYYTSESYGNPYEIHESDFYLADEYEDCLEEYTDEALSEAGNLNILADNYTLTSEDNSYELIFTSTVSNGQTSTTYEYVYIVDTNYELTAIAYSEETFQGIKGWYAEKTASSEVEASMSDFDPDDWSASSPTELEDYTLKLKFTLEEGGEAQTIPENAALFFEYWEEGQTDSGFIELYQDDTDGTYSITFTKIDITYYSYCVYLGYLDDEYHTSDTCYELVSNAWFMIDGTEGSNYTKIVEYVLTSSFDTIIPDSYTFYISIYYEDTLQSAPEGTTIYANGGWDVWASFVALEAVGDGTYALTISNLTVSYFDIQLVLAKTETTNVDYTYRITADGNEGNVFCQVEYCSTSSSATAYAVGALDNLIPPDTRNTIYYYTLSFTFTYSEETVSLPSYTSAYIQYGPQGQAWGDFIQLASGDNDTYYITFDSIEVGTYEYQIMLAEANTSPSWNNDHMITDSNQSFVVSGTEEDYYTNEITIASQIDVNNTIQDPSLIETRTNCTITYYFVNDASTPTEYYAIPSYADAYITGYFTSTETWTNYSIGGGTKLNAVSDQASDGYSVTLDTIHTGDVTYNMYFEYNTNAQNHDTATEASWNVSHAIAGSDNTTMYIPTTGDCKVYIEQDPSNIISDDPSSMTCTIAVKDTASTGKTLYCSGSMNTWNNSNAMTYNSSGSDYQYSYTFSVDPNESLSMGIFNDSSWNDSVQFSSGTTDYWNSSNNIVFAGSVVGTYENTLIILVVDGTNFGSTTDHVTITSVTITH